MDELFNFLNEPVKISDAGFSDPSVTNPTPTSPLKVIL